MAWRIAQSLLTLLAEVNALYPDRYKGTDGGISGYTYGAGGVVVNPNNQSSHNINSQGVICAFDITTGDYDGGISTAAGQWLAEQVRIAIRDQPRGIPAYPIHYMAPPYVPTPGPYIATYDKNWEWQPYGGSDLHTSHLHITVDWDVFHGGAPSGQADYDTTLPWNLTRYTGALNSSITPITEEGFLMSIPEETQVELVGNARKLVYGQQSQDKVLGSLTTQVKQLSTQLEEVVGNARKAVYGIQDVKAGLAALPAKDIAAAIPTELAQQVVDALAERLGK